MPLIAPAVSAITYETLQFEGGFQHQSIYKGLPRPELEHAWDEITSRRYSLESV
jgi:hypothetical protein